MPAIKSGDWLKKARTLSGWSMSTLAEKSGVSAIMIQKIEKGERKGSGTTWDKLLDVLQVSEPAISYECGEIIEELHEDIDEFGADTPCWLIYSYAGDNIIFTNYILVSDEVPFLGPEELDEDEKAMKSTLADALELFEHQDRIL